MLLSIPESGWRGKARFASDEVASVADHETRGRTNKMLNTLIVWTVNTGIDYGVSVQLVRSTERAKYLR